MEKIKKEVLILKKIVKSMQSYFSNEFLFEVKNISSFLFSYTIIFFIAAFFIRYASPFAIAFIIAICFRKVKNKMLSINKKRKYKIISEESISLFLTIIFFITFGGVLFLIIYKIAIALSNYYTYITDKDTLNYIIENVTMQINEYLKPSIFNNVDELNVDELVSKAVSIGSNILAIFIKNLLNIIRIIPTGIIYILITIISTFFFIKDIDKIIEKIKWVFSSKSINIIKTIRNEKNYFISGYTKAYMIIAAVMWFYSSILYKISNIEHFIICAFVTAILDALPLIGAGMMYGMFSIVCILNGKFKGVIILIIGYLGAVALRQYLEQRLVSSFLGVPPIVVIIALFFVITPIGFIGMFYFLGAFLSYSVINKSSKKCFMEKDEKK